MLFIKSLLAAVLCVSYLTVADARTCASMSCAGAHDVLYQRITDVNKWCVDPTSNMCRTAKNNCRVAKSECDRICKLEGRTCPGNCPP
jgi:hypothetical protein